MFAFVISKPKKHPSTNGLYWLTAFLALSALGILNIQLVLVSEPRYYFYKTMVALCLTIAPLSIAGICMAIDNLPWRKNAAVACIIAAICITTGALVGKTPSRTTDLVTYIKGARPYSNQVRGDVYSYLKQSTRSAYSDKSYRFYVNKKSQMESFYTTMLAKSGRPGSECFFETRKSVVAGSPDISDTLQRVSKYCEGYSVDIFIPASDIVNTSSVPGNVRLIPYKPSVIMRVIIVRFYAIS